MPPKEPGRYTKLKKGNLRDHITDLELIFTMLGEAATTEITHSIDAHGFDENLSAPRAAGLLLGEKRSL